MNTPNPGQLSPIQLENSAFIDVRITAQPDGKLEGVLATNVEFGGNPIDAQKGLWQVVAKVNLNQASDVKPTYLGHVQCVGTFRVIAKVPEDKADKLEKLVIVNGTGMLYSIIREMISNITARGPWPMVQLPAQFFSGTYDQGQAKRKETSPKSDA